MKKTLLYSIVQFKNLCSGKNLLWIMNSFLLIAFSAFQLQAADTAKEERISLFFEQTPVRVVLTYVEDHSDYKFFYNNSTLDPSEKVSISLNDVKIETALETLFEDTDIDYKIRGNQIVLRRDRKTEGSRSFFNSILNLVEKRSINLTDGSDEEAVQQTISGKVIDENGDEMIGVNVFVKGTTTGTTTDIDGTYKITIPDDATTLVFSFIGYLSMEEEINGRSVIDVSMVPDIKTLSEIIVVGYGTQEKKEVTGAISQISSDEIKKSSAISISNALAGQVPGLIVNQTNSEPGRDDARILIRGMGTTRNTDALIVVDGVANRDGLSRIDPNDIETISVLKDASAAIYGAQAANGVILITTKRGKEGKPTINYSFNQGFVSPTRKIELANAALYAKSVNAWSDQQGQGPVYTDEQIANFENGTSPSTDWIDEVYKSHSVQNRHSLTLSGGTDVVKYFLSAGTAYQNGLVTNDETTKFRQYNFRSNIDAQVTPRLKMGLDLAGRREDYDWLQYSDATIYSNTIRAAPDIPATIDGLPTPGRENSNPLAIAQGPGYLNLKRNVINSTLSGEYKIPYVEGLSVDGFAAIDVFQGFRKHFYQQYTVYEDTNGDGEPEPRKAGPNINNTFLRQDDQNWQSVTLNAKLKYERNFGAHDISAFIAYEQNEIKADSFYVQRNRYESDQIDEIFAGSANSDFHSNDGGAFESARQNYFGRVAYTFKDKYIAQFHFRYDGSSNFPGGKRFGFFPGVSAGWRISEEPFMSGVPVISNLKLRGSWGQLGNDRVAPFQYLNIFSFASPSSSYVLGGSDVNALIPGVAANPNITWETKTTVDLGVDMGLFENKVTVEFDYFSESRKDILAPRNVTIPNYTGLLLPDENIAEVENKGFDAMASYRNTIGDITFNVGGNITYARNKVVFVDEGDIYPEDYQKLEGNPIGTRLAYEFIGIYRNQDDLDTYPGLNGVAQLGDPIYRDVNEDGEVTNADRVRVDGTSQIGNVPIPELQYGINLAVQYKGLDFSALFQGQARAHQYLRYTFNNGNNALKYFLENAWTEDNPDASLPAFNRHNTNEFLSTLWLRDVSFLRLKNIELGYTLPDVWVSKIGIERLRVYINGYNLLTFDKLKKDGMTDPESANIEAWQFPHTKSFNFGLNLTL